MSYQKYKNKSDYPNTVAAGAWETVNGHINTMALDEKAVAVLQSVEVGGKILVRRRSEESKARAKNPKTTPEFYIEVVPADAVREFDEEKSKRNSGL